MAKVLYIEDDKEQIDLYTFAFSTYAPEIEFVGERYAKEALEKISMIKPDLILLDIIMPDMDGIMVLKNLKGIHESKDIPVIIFTNSAEKGLPELCQKLGAKDYWEKTGFEPKELAERVKNLLGVK